VNLWVAEWAKSFLDLVAMVKGWTFLPLSAVMQTSTEEFFYLLFLFHVVPNCILCNYVLCMHLCGVLSLGEDYPGSISSVKKVFPMGLWLRHRIDMASTFFFFFGREFWTEMEIHDSPLISSLFLLPSTCTREELSIWYGGMVVSNAIEYGIWNME